MYSWDDGTEGWARPDAYAYGGGAEAAKARAEAAERARRAGPRSYGGRSGPNEALVDPRKTIESDSPNPVLVAVDVTGSMSTWPAEIFDRLPLLASTLAQYRPDVELAFAAIGDAGCDRWPLQVTGFQKGYGLEQQLGALYGEGGGGDEPESYGLFARWALGHVRVKADRPFLLVFGDAPMHERVPAAQIRGLLGDEGAQDVSAIECFRKLAATWDVWFLRRPGGRAGDHVERQWASAIGAQKILHLDDELRGVDFAMGLVARRWGHFEDFKQNMAARQDEARVASLASRIAAAVPSPTALACPKCSAPIPLDAGAKLTCGFCGASLLLPVA